MQLKYRAWFKHRVEGYMLSNHVTTYGWVFQGHSQAIWRVGSLRTRSGPSNSFYNYGDFKTC